MDFTNLSFKDYNTKAAYDDKGSSAKGLVAAYMKENPNGSAEDFYSKLAPEWNTENVKKEIALAYPQKKESAPTVQKDANLTENDEKFLNETNAVANQAENDELARQREQNQTAWDDTWNNLTRQGDAFRQIDDHFIDGLPKSLRQAYKSGQFGEPGSKDAKSTLGYFIRDIAGSALKNLSNGFMTMAGKSPLFSNTGTAWEEYQKTNLGNAMQNRWDKYNKETQAATDMLIERGKNNEDITNAIRQISSDKRMQTAFNMMNDKQKAYLIDVYTQIGDKIGGLNDKDLVNFLAGAAIFGTDMDWKEALGVLATRIPALSKRLGLKMDETKGVTGTPNESTTQTAGKSGTVKGVKLSDGTELKSGWSMNKEESQALKDKATELLQKYYDGKISEEDFEKDYTALENYSNSHGWRKLISGGIISLKDAKKQARNNKLGDLDTQFNDLRTALKRGNISEEEFNKKSEEIKAEAQKWGVSEKELQSLIEKSEKAVKQSRKKAK